MKEMQANFDIDDYNRRTYGIHYLEPVLIDLLKSPTIKRLKQIQQHGPDVWVWKHADITRFEHSLGVLLLLKKTKASLKTQIAGLIHDVSHTAFSHAVDFAFDQQLTADFGDEAYEKFVLNSEIPKILSGYGYSIDYFLNIKHYPLVKKSLPDLCADRIDYLCRDMYRYSLIDETEISTILNHLLIADKEFVFDDLEAALLFARKYIEAGKKVFASAETIFFHTVIGEAIQIGFEVGLITESDLFKTDQEVKEKLFSCDHQAIKTKLSLISPNTKLIKVTNNYDYHLRVKPRITDPKVKVGKRCKRLSDIDDSYRKEMESAIREAHLGHFVKVKRDSVK